MCCFKQVAFNQSANTSSATSDMNLMKWLKRLTHTASRVFGMASAIAAIDWTTKMSFNAKSFGFNSIQKRLNCVADKRAIDQIDSNVAKSAAMQIDEQLESNWNSLMAAINKRGANPAHFSHIYFSCQWLAIASPLSIDLNRFTVDRSKLTCFVWQRVKNAIGGKENNLLIAFLSCAWPVNRLAGKSTSNQRKIEDTNWWVNIACGRVKRETMKFVFRTKWVARSLSMHYLTNQPIHMKQIAFDRSNAFAAINNTHWRHLLITFIGDCRRIVEPVDKNVSNAPLLEEEMTTYKRTRRSLIWNCHNCKKRGQPMINDNWFTLAKNVICCRLKNDFNETKTRVHSLKRPHSMEFRWLDSGLQTWNSILCKDLWQEAVLSTGESA